MGRQKNAEQSAADLLLKKFLKMIWQDKGYLLSQYKYNENSVIANFYTEKHGKVSGIIFGLLQKD